MRLWWFALVLAGVLALPGAAQACPPGPCLKYRHLVRPPPPPPPPRVITITYARTIPAALPRFGRAAIVRFLTGSTWELLGGNARTPRLRFVDPTTITQHFAQPPGGNRDRTVLIRGIRATGEAAVIDIDGDPFSLAPCRIGRQWSTCLTSITQPQNGFGGAGYGGLGYGGY